MQSASAFRLAWGIVALAAFGAGPAQAHPHVLVTAKAAILVNAEGKMTGIRQRWTFDEAYSSYSTTGMKRGKDGRVEKAELEDLAKLNVESLKEFGYFTNLKKGRSALEFADPAPGYFLEDDGTALTLNFVLPLKTPVAPQTGIALRVDDETLFVAFTFAEADPVTFEGNAGACRIEMKRPKKTVDAAEMSKLGEDFFNALQPGQADQYASSARLTCP